MHTNRIHRVRCKLENAVEDQSTALEKHVTPVPAIVLHDVMGFGLYPKIEHDECDTAEPSRR
jgi:hypothetical protein